MDPAQRREFEAHLAGCAECQAEVAALLQRRSRQPPATEVAHRPGRAVRILIGAAVVLVTLIVGYALGWWAWQLAHR